MSGIEDQVSRIDSLPNHVKGGEAPSSVSAPTLDEASVKAQLDKLMRLYTESFGAESEYVTRLAAISRRVEELLHKIAATQDVSAPAASKPMKTTAAEESLATRMPFFYTVSNKLWRANSNLADFWFFKLPHQVSYF